MLVFVGIITLVIGLMLILLVLPKATEILMANETQILAHAMTQQLKPFYGSSGHFNHYIQPLNAQQSLTTPPKSLNLSSLALILSFTVSTGTLILVAFLIWSLMEVL